MTQTAIKLEIRRPTQERGRRSVAAIRKAAIDLVSTQDVGSLTIAEIARSASVGVGTFYHYYPSKESLFLDLRGQLFAETAVTLGGAFDLRLESTEDFRSGLERLILGWIELVGKRRQLELAILSVSYAHPEVAAVLRTQEEPVTQLVAAILARYAKVLRPCDPVATAEAIVLLIASVVGQTIRDPALGERPDPLVRETVRMMAHYLMTDAVLEPESGPDPDPDPDDDTDDDTENEETP